MSKAEIDTSAPFQSVKEAVMLFGERVLAAEVYANKLKEIQNGTSEYEHKSMTNELEETKQNLQKAQKESIHMARCLSYLQQELKLTKMELQQLKTRESESEKRVLLDLDYDREDLKFESIEQVKKVETTTSSGVDHGFQKKKYVTFANPPSVAQVMLPPPPAAYSEAAVLQRHPSLRKKKKKALIPLIGGIFSKFKRGSNSEVALA
ncbi:hypothetical protein ACJIZ3_024817 [Penstemon smallii]|uniref:Uncharacterized protein n=1 Tax=Penstemon smallii TaxID=265156 RepID=A0ABD3TUL5_9LAMI